MKHISLKTKLTILSTTLLTIISCVVLTLLFSLSGQELLSSVQSQLEEKVSGARNNIQFKDGSLKFDSELLELEHGIYLSVYASDGTLLYGKIPYGFENAAAFEDGSIREFKENGNDYYLMDLIYEIPGYGVVDIRGITSITDAESSFRTTIRLAGILLPVMIILCALLGHFMIKKTLQPVRQITDTVQTIQQDGKLSHRIALGQGKDEIYHLAITFDQLLDQIEASMLREQQFTSDVSHELRTPLSAMMLQCEDLLANKNLDTETRNGINVLYQRTRYLTQILSQLLLLSRADQGRARIEREKIDFSELTQMAIDEIQETAKEKNITVQANIAPDLFLIGDETLLIRFWMNLLTNAVTYGKNNGHIWITLQNWGENIIGEIHDDGIGISEDALPHIWERFYQADPSRADHNSSGLGLSMVQWIVKAHNGEIDVSSTVGEGTRFWFKMPGSL